MTDQDDVPVPRPSKLVPCVVLNTGIRVGGSVAIVCSNFWETGGLASFVEEATLRSTAYCNECKTMHRVRPILEAFGDGMFPVGGLFGDANDFMINVPQLLTLTAGGAAHALPKESS